MAIIRVISRVCGGLLFVLGLSISTGCGGGTYGTGGNRYPVALIQDGNGLPITGVTVIGVGTEELFTSSAAGLITLPLNESFPLAPIRIILPSGTIIDRYINSAEVGTRESPILITIEASRETVAGVPDATDFGQEVPNCSAALDSWHSGLADPELDITTVQRTKAQGILDDNSLSCEQKIVALGDAVFSDKLGS